MRLNFPILCSILFFLVSCGSHKVVEIGNQKVPVKKLFYQDDFEGDLSLWIIEKEHAPHSKVYSDSGKMVVDVGGGATIWFKNQIECSDILIEYKRKVVVNGGKNDRLSDLNQFWMAEDPANKNLFTRSGSFRDYDDIRMYYAGIGGNANTTSRFRKYPGNGDRDLIYDLTSKEYLLQANKTYFIQILVHDGTTKFFVDGKEYFSYTDENPLTQGYFGFRTVQSHQEIDDFKVYKLSEF